MEEKKIETNGPGGKDVSLTARSPEQEQRNNRSCGQGACHPVQNGDPLEPNLSEQPDPRKQEFWSQCTIPRDSSLQKFLMWMLAGDKHWKIQRTADFFSTEFFFFGKR